VAFGRKTRTVNRIAIREVFRPQRRFWHRMFKWVLLLVYPVPQLKLQNLMVQG
jgi:hypothetical protein